MLPPAGGGGHRPRCCLWCLPSWRAQGWRCRHCRQGFPTPGEERLCGRQLAIEEDNGAHGGSTRLLRMWQPIPFITVGELVCFLAEEMIDHPAASMTFRIGTRIFMHPADPSWRSRTVLWALDPGHILVTMHVRAVEPGGVGEAVRLRLRPGPLHSDGWCRVNVPGHKADRYRAP